DNKLDVEDVIPSQWDSSQPWVTTHWAIAVAANAPDFADLTFELHQDGIFSNPVLDSFPIRLFKRTEPQVSFSDRFDTGISGWSREGTITTEDGGLEHGLVVE